MKLATFNARVETVAEKPMFRGAFQRTRCLIPASGYYEWHDAPDGKQPYYFTRRDGTPITIAGLWDQWRDRQAGETIRSCAMLGTCSYWYDTLHRYLPGAPVTDTPTPPPPPQRNLFVWVAVAAVLVLLALGPWRLL